MGTEKEEQDKCHKEWIANFESYVQKQQQEHREEINRLEAKVKEGQPGQVSNDQLLQDLANRNEEIKQLKAELNSLQTKLQQMNKPPEKPKKEGDQIPKVEQSETHIVKEPVSEPIPELNITTAQKLGQIIKQKTQKEKKKANEVKPVFSDGEKESILQWESEVKTVVSQIGANASDEQKKVYEGWKEEINT